MRRYGAKDNRSERFVNTQSKVRPMEQIAKHIVFKGHVQGVGFRYTTHRIAGRYAVTGYVRNCSDGTVEMLVQGPPPNVDACLDDVYDTMAGYIRDTQIKAVSPNPKHTAFQITF